MNTVSAVRWSPDGRAVRILDQRALPHEIRECDVRSLEEACECIRTLAVRGAPAIGVFAAMALAVLLQPHAEAPRADFDARLAHAAAALRATRPTAVNLAWALDRSLAAAAAGGDSLGALQALRRTATAIAQEDAAMCRSIGEHALPLIAAGARVLTHCNAGALATAGIGTALAPLYLAHAAGRALRVYVGETRPLLQGSRLTAWELQQAGIPVTITPDGAVASLLQQRAVDLVLVGADRIAANGDTANKIGTYALAVLARHHGIPFYVAAPSSTVDATARDGNAIPIEQRDASEVRSWQGHTVAPADTPAYNPAFDVTPAALIHAIITERGVHTAPYDFSQP